MKKRILSGMRPTGKLHLGHLVGALSNWVKLQEAYQCFFMVADWHALMSEYEDPKELDANSFEVARDMLAAGIDPEKSVLFIQSHVPEHLELAMIFNVITPLSWLERCPTYKEQLRDLAGRDLTTYGFLGYPVLQAADIAIYKANAVPVGVDQLPHLELTREIIRRFHGLYKKNIFPEPEPLLTSTPKLAGLDNRKMSKSLGNFIALSDSPDTIEKKVTQMITDPERIRLKDKGHPDICTVFSYYLIFAGVKKDEVRAWCEGAQIGCTECKKRLAGIIIDMLAPVRKKREELTDKKVEEILKEGAGKARKAAAATLDEAKRLINLVPDKYDL
jgi:tryptophanyl-tRNA synthetase